MDPTEWAGETRGWTAICFQEMIANFCRMLPGAYTPCTLKGAADTPVCALPPTHLAEGDHKWQYEGACVPVFGLALGG